MKKSIIVMIVAVLLIGALFISCNDETTAIGDKLNAVRISVGSSRAVDYTVESDVPAVADLHWYYSAFKADAGLYNTGETQWSSVQLVEGTQINLFSQGDWTFCFYGYKEEMGDKPKNPMLAAVYYSVNLSVTVDNADVYVDIPLTNGPGIKDGKVILEELSFTLPADIINGQATGKFVLNVYRDGALVETSDDITYSSTATSYAFKFDEKDEWDDEDATAGQHEYTFDVVFTYGEKTAVVASDSLSVTLDRGLKITFSGAVSYTDPLNYVIVGEITGQTKATAAIPASTAAAGVTVTSNVSPAGVDNPDAVATTAVQFAAGTIPAGTGADYTLNTDVKGISATAAAAAKAEEGDKTFVVADGSVPVASIDLTLKQGDSTISLNETGLVTVTTYVAKSLTNACVYYDGEEFTLAGAIPVANTFTYDAETGKLVFYTNHFSTFVLGSEDAAIDITQNKAYQTMHSAVLGSKSGDEILLVKNDDTIRIMTGKDIVIDMGGNTMTGILYVDGGKVTLKNGTFQELSASYLYGKATQVEEKYSVFTVEEDATVIAANDNGFVVWPCETSGNPGYGVELNVYGKIVALEGGAGIFVTGNCTDGDSVINVYGEIEGDALGIALNGFATVNVFEGAKITGNDETAIEVRAGNLNITGGTFISYSTTDPVEAHSNGSGTTTSGAALAIAQHTTERPIRVNILGGTFTGNVGLYQSCPEKNKNPDMEIKLIDGKFISKGKDNYAIYVLNGSKVTTLSNEVRDAAVGRIYLGIDETGLIGGEGMTDVGDVDDEG